MILQYRQLVKRVLNMSAILIHDTLQTTSPFTDAVINEAPWQRASLQQEHLFKLINGVKRHAIVDWLLHPLQMI